MLKQINIQISQELNDRIFEAAHKSKVTKSEYIRAAVYRYLLIQEKEGIIAPDVAIEKPITRLHSRITETDSQKLLKKAIEMKDFKGGEFHPVPKPGKKK